MPTNKGPSTTSLDDIEHIITDFAEQLELFPDTAFEWRPFVQLINMVGIPGNTREVIYSNQSDGLATKLTEGAKPDLNHAEFERQLVTVEKYGEALGITEEMLEDSRLDEMQAAMEKVTNLMLNRYTERFFNELKTGVYSSTDVPAPIRNKSWANAAAHLYSADHDGTLVAQSQAGHVYNTGSTTLFLGDISLAMRHISEHGFSPDTLMINEAMLQKVVDLAAFTKDIAAVRLVEDIAQMGTVVGRLHGLDVVVVTGGWLDDDEFIVTDRASQPLIFLEKRRMRIDNFPSNQGTLDNFDLTTASVSARFGFDTKTPHKGATVIVTLAV